MSASFYAICDRCHVYCFVGSRGGLGPCAPPKIAALSKPITGVPVGYCFAGQPNDPAGTHFVARFVFDHAYCSVDGIRIEVGHPQDKKRYKKYREYDPDNGDKFPEPKLFRDIAVAPRCRKYSR